jgi:hypothetical protein
MSFMAPKDPQRSGTVRHPQTYEPGPNPETYLYLFFFPSSFDGLGRLACSHPELV